MREGEDYHLNRNRNNSARISETPVMTYKTLFIVSGVLAVTSYFFLVKYLDTHDNYYQRNH